MYFITQTITTVGYGDVNSNNVLERVFTIILTYIGVMVFTFASGSFGSIMMNYDIDQAEKN